MYPVKTKKDIQVLAPMYRCPAGINELNEEIQELVNPGREEDTLIHNAQKFRVDDKVIQLVNRSEKNIMNGDIGIITNLIFRDGEYKGVTVLFDTLEIDYTLEELDDLKLAYAISIHKSQGSEFELVIMPVSSSYKRMLYKKLIYTAVTRAKKRLIIIGEPNAFMYGIRNNNEITRKTSLLEKLLNNLNKK